MIAVFFFLTCIFLHGTTGSFTGEDISLWVEFLDELSVLQIVNVCALPEKERAVFLLNLYHAMVSYTSNYPHNCLYNYPYTLTIYNSRNKSGLTISYYHPSHPLFPLSLNVLSSTSLTLFHNPPLTTSHTVLLSLTLTPPSPHSHTTPISTPYPAYCLLSRLLPPHSHRLSTGL